MKKFLLIFATFTLLFSCKTKTVNTDDNLPKDISLKPERTSNRQKDEESLQKLRAEIDAIINSEKCTDVKDWRISPIGSKPCGGPTEYIAYPIKKENEILQKINNYSVQQNEFNKKYGLVSDCMMVMPPTLIICENGKAVLFGANSGSSDVR